MKGKKLVKEKTELSFKLTNLYNFTKDIFRAVSRAIPSAIFKLVLTLADRELRSETDVGNQLGILSAQSLLLWSDRLNPVCRRKLEIVVVRRL